MNEKFANNPETVNAIVSVVGALAMCITRHLAPEQRAAIADDLARLAASSERNGNTTLETMLIDLHRAVR
jgi:pyridoxine 5'-phosphate synthase PdxJ